MPSPGARGGRAPSVKVVANLDPARPLAEVAAHARRVESLGYDALHVAETVHDPFLVSLLALEHTSTLVVRTSVALAFPRSPMVVALAAWDLAGTSGGRFQLGLGTQIKANIEGRYSVPWTGPVGRMREYVGSLRAIFSAFQRGDALDFEGEHYRFTRLQPYFNPGPIDVEPPPIWLGGVNERMCHLAGEVADGFVTHPTGSNPRHLEAVCLPNLRASGRGVELVVGTPIATGRTAVEVDAERERHRRTLAFLYSTPEYNRTLELHGWTDLGERLRALTRSGRWDELDGLVTDEVLDALVPQATYDDLPAVLSERFGGVADGMLVPPPEDPSDDAAFTDVLRALQAVPARQVG